MFYSDDSRPFANGGMRHRKKHMLFIPNLNRLVAVKTIHEQFHAYGKQKGWQRKVILDQQTDFPYEEILTRVVDGVPVIEEGYRLDGLEFRSERNEKNERHGIYRMKFPTNQKEWGCHQINTEYYKNGLQRYKIKQKFVHNVLREENGFFANRKELAVFDSKGQPETTTTKYQEDDFAGGNYRETILVYKNGNESEKINNTFVNHVLIKEEVYSAIGNDYCSTQFDKNKILHNAQFIQIVDPKTGKETYELKNYDHGILMLEAGSRTNGSSYVIDYEYQDEDNYKKTIKELDGFVKTSVTDEYYKNGVMRQKCVLVPGVREDRSYFDTEGKAHGKQLAIHYFKNEPYSRMVVEKTMHHGELIGNKKNIIQDGILTKKYFYIKNRSKGSISLDDLGQAHGVSRLATFDPVSGKQTSHKKEIFSYGKLLSCTGKRLDGWHYDEKIDAAGVPYGRSYKSKAKWEFIKTEFGTTMEKHQLLKSFCYHGDQMQGVSYEYYKDASMEKVEVFKNNKKDALLTFVAQMDLAQLQFGDFVKVLVNKDERSKEARAKGRAEIMQNRMY